ncbi:hypothetical protein [Streptomyces sp. TRM64462]|uniref:hypothetical protein n=1 Tax=Streptomyces sp. TRM64462 TaxID=2741726 RepID=UPI001586B4B9|nr:hypothetical protein [Streptomyces sp. TRM64462]
MHNSGRRSARLRLARRRPAPDRARARVRDDEEERQPAPRQSWWWRRADWTRIGTVAAIVAGIGTLVFTGVTTYYQAKVSQEQLEQARNDADRDVRSQAARVSFWRSSTDETLRVHLMNRSADPVYGVSMDIAVAEGTERWKARLSLASVAPCTELIIERDDLRDESMSRKRHGRCTCCSPSLSSSWTGTGRAGSAPP